MKSLRATLRQISVCMVCVLGLPALKANADTTIDSFQGRPTDFPLVAGASNSVEPVGPLPHVLGGRGISLTATTPAGGTTPLGSPAGASSSEESLPVSVDIDNLADVSFLDYQSLSAAATGDLSIGYGGDSGFAPAPTPMALAVDPSLDFLRLTFLGYNHAGGQDMVLNTYLQEQLDQGVDAQPVSVLLTNSGPQVVDIPLTTLSGPTLDFVTFEFLAPAGTNFQLESVALVTPAPEPASLLLVFISVPMLLNRRR